jgi:hypothetical protein
LNSKISSGLLILLVALSGMGAKAPRKAQSETVAVLFTAAPSYKPLAWMQGAERFPDGASIYYRDSESRRMLFPEFFATADPSVSYDANRIIFTGKKTSSEAWQIWEASFDSFVPHQLTQGANAAVRPFYLPGDRFVYSRIKDGRFVLMNAAIDGSDEHQISYADSNILAPDVLRDGRILLQSAYLDGNEFKPEVFAVYSDGSGFESIRCDHGTSRYEGHELSSGDIVFTHGTSLGRISSPYATEKPINLPIAAYSEIAETPSRDWIVSVVPNSTEEFSLWLRRAGSSNTSSFLSLPSFNLVQPVVRMARPEPKKHPSAVHDWKFANLLALNVYTSKLLVADHSVASVSVYTRDVAGNEKLLGSAPVESDGSFFVRVPGDQPIRFELSDKKGKSIARERGWFWARSGEQRICVGCHAGPERAPDNAVPAILEKSTEPFDMTQTLSATSGGH